MGAAVPGSIFLHDVAPSCLVSHGMLGEKLLPKQSHTIQVVAHTPSETLIAGTGVPTQQVAPVN